MGKESDKKLLISGAEFFNLDHRFILTGHPPEYIGYGSPCLLDRARTKISLRFLMKSVNGLRN
jgi:hypothetical protein